MHIFKILNIISVILDPCHAWFWGVVRKIKEIALVVAQWAEITFSTTWFLMEIYFHFRWSFYYVFFGLNGISCHAKKQPTIVWSSWWRNITQRLPQLLKSLGFPVLFVTFVFLYSSLLHYFLTTWQLCNDCGSNVLYAWPEALKCYLFHLWEVVSLAAYHFFFLSPLNDTCRFLPNLCIVVSCMVHAKN